MQINPLESATAASNGSKGVRNGNSAIFVPRKEFHTRIVITLLDVMASYGYACCNYGKLAQLRLLCKLFLA